MMNKILTEWNRFLTEEEQSGVPPNADNSAPRAKASTTLSTVVGGMEFGAKILSFMNNEYKFTNDLKIVCFMQFLNRRQKPLTVQDIPNGAQKFAKFSNDFYQPLLNGDLNLVDEVYVRQLENFYKTGKFVLDIRMVTMLEDYFKSPVTGWIGSRQGFEAVGSKSAAEYQSASTFSRISSKNVLVEINNSIGRHVVVYKNNMISIRDAYDFDDSINELKKMASGKGNIPASNELSLKSVFDSAKEHAKNIAFGNGSGENELYSSMFDFTKAVHSTGYNGYMMQFDFPADVEKERLLYNLEKLKKQLKMKYSAEEEERTKKTEEDMKSKYEYDLERASSKTEVPTKTFTPSRCSSLSDCKNMGGVCIDLNESDSVSDTRGWDKKYTGGSLLSAFYYFGFLTSRQYEDASKFAATMCVPLEMVNDKQSLRFWGLSIVKNENEIKKLFDLYKKTYSSRGMSFLFEPDKEPSRFERFKSNTFEKFKSWAVGK